MYEGFEAQKQMDLRGKLWASGMSLSYCLRLGGREQRGKTLPIKLLLWAHVSFGCSDATVSPSKRQSLDLRGGGWKGAIARLWWAFPVQTPWLDLSGHCMLMKGLSPGVKQGHPKDTFKPVITSVAFLGLHGMCLSTREVTVLRSGLDNGAGGRRYRRRSCPMSLI